MNRFDEKIQAVLDVYHERMKHEPSSPTADMSREEWRSSVLLAVGPDAGRFIYLLAKSLSAPNILEVGTSFGYSGIWLAAAARKSGGRVTTLELEAHKSEYAREMASKAGLADYIDFKVGDALPLIDSLPGGIDFVLLDLWKDLYVPCLERVYSKLNPGAIIVADNMLKPGGPSVDHYREVVRAMPGMRSILLPVGSGLEVSRYEPA